MNHRNIPLGYAINGGNITINEAEADTVREIAEQYLSGKSLKAIAEMLTENTLSICPARPIGTGHA